MPTTIGFETIIINGVQYLNVTNIKSIGSLTISTSNNGDLILLPNGTGITQVGDAGSSSHSLNTNDDFFVSGRIEVDGIAYFDKGITIKNGYSIVGNSNVGYIIPNPGTQTLNCLTFGLGSNNHILLVVSESHTGVDFAHELQTNPTEFWHASDGLNIKKYLSRCHNGDDAEFNSGRGGYQFKVPAQHAEGTITLTGIPVADETFVINATTITAKADGSGNVDHFTIGADAAETVANIVATLAECSESGNLTAWDGAGDTVVIQWNTAGTAGNSITFTSSLSNASVDGSGTLGGTHAGVAADTLLAMEENAVSTFGGALKNEANVGTVNTGVTAAEYGDGYNHVSVLTVDQADAVDIADNASIADGYLLYTFPAGVIVVDYAYMSMALQVASSEAQSDTPDVGLGTVIASGAVATLDGTATFENIITGQTAADSNGTATVKTALPTAGVPFIIESGDAHTIHFNIADTWADDTGGDLTGDIAGTVVLAWRFLA